MTFPPKLALVDVVAVLMIVGILVLAVAADSGAIQRYRRHLARAMLLMAATFTYLVLTSDPGESFFLSQFTKEDEKKKDAGKSDDKKTKKEDRRAAGKDASGPGDGDEGDGGDKVKVNTPDAQPGGEDGPPRRRGKKGGDKQHAGKGGKNRMESDGGGGDDGNGGGDQADDEGGDEPGVQTASDGKGGKLKLLQDCDECPSLVYVPRSKAILGADESQQGYQRHEGPAQMVAIPYSFWMGRYEVTRREFQAFLDATGHVPRRGCMVAGSWQREANFHAPGFPVGPQHPAVCVSRRDAFAYLEWLRKRTGQTYRLPTETEWELAARAGTKTTYGWGNKIDESFANFDNVQPGPVPVGSYGAVRGLHDMAGNVWEMTEDCWASDIAARPANGDPFRSRSCDRQVLKGGSWYNPVAFLRPAARWSMSMYTAGNGVGFRVVRDLGADPLPTAQPDPEDDGRGGKGKRKAATAGRSTSTAVTTQKGAAPRSPQ